MKINEICQGITERLQHLEGSKVDMADLHDHIKKASEEFFQEKRIENIKYTTWYTTWNFVINNNYSFKPITVDIDLTDDKRCKYKRKGKVNKITIIPKEEVFGDMTFKEYIEEIKRREKIESIERVKNRIVELEKELKELKEYLLKSES